jgi:hypothetical protein
MMKIWGCALAATILAGVPFELYAQNSTQVLPAPRKIQEKGKSETIPLLDVKEMTTAPSSYQKVFAEAVLHEKKMEELVNPALADFFGASQSSHLNYCWHSPAFCHYPLYFEQPNYERFGNKNHILTSPIYSASHFYGSLMLFPLHALHDRPFSCTSTLGNQRPGDCVHMKPVLKTKVRNFKSSPITFRFTDDKR